MPEKLTNDLINLIFSTSQMMRERARQAGKLNPGSVAQTASLRFIKERKMITMKDLVEFLRIKPPSATSLANNMAKEGLIRRVEDKQDRRVVKLTLTKQGENYLAAKSKAMFEMMRENMSVLNNEDKKNLIKIFKKLSNIQ